MTEEDKDEDMGDVQADMETHVEDDNKVDAQAVAAADSVEQKVDANGGAKADANISEKESDSPEDTRPQIQEIVRLIAEGASVNALPTAAGKMLMALRTDGCEHLLAGARCNTGVKAGRYMFEAMVVEQIQAEEQEDTPLVRLGFVTEGGTVLRDAATHPCVFFDSQGFYSDGTDHSPIVTTFTRSTVLAVVLNADPEGVHAFTISLFVDGVRVGSPMSLPEAVRGKPLYPAVTCRAATLRVNFGSVPMRALPFRCRMLQTAAAEDCVVEPNHEPADDKHEIIIPVVLPGEGMLAWCDQFLCKNRHTTELSQRSFNELDERMLLASFELDGSSWTPSRPSSTPDAEGAFQHLVENISPLASRSFMLGDMRQNLTIEGRKAALSRYPSDSFRRIATVLMGKPDEGVEEGAPLDMPQAQLAACFQNFSLPVEEEGFESVRFERLPADQAQAYLKNWILERKQTLPIEGIQPSKWFKDKWSEWGKMIQKWKRAQVEWKDVLDELNKMKQADEADEKPTDLETPDLEFKKEDWARTSIPDEVQDILDIGSGEPLFANFDFEDWALLGLRYELHLLVYSFRRDVGDSERTSFSQTHLRFYYGRYYMRNFNLEFFGCDNIAALLQLIPDTMAIGGSAQLFETKLDVDTSLEYFVKRTEEDRRDRSRRIEAGDETAGLKFLKDATPSAPLKERPHAAGVDMGAQPRTPPSDAMSSARAGWSRATKQILGDADRRKRPPPSTDAARGRPPLKFLRTGSAATGEGDAYASRRPAFTPSAPSYGGSRTTMPDSLQPRRGSMPVSNSAPNRNSGRPLPPMPKGSALRSEPPRTAAHPRTAPPRSESRTAATPRTPAPTRPSPPQSAPPSRLLPVGRGPEPVGRVPAPWRSQDSGADGGTGGRPSTGAAPLRRPLPLPNGVTLTPLPLQRTPLPVPMSARASVSAGTRDDFRGFSGHEGPVSSRGNLPRPQPSVGAPQAARGAADHGRSAIPPSRKAAAPGPGNMGKGATKGKGVQGKR